MPSQLRFVEQPEPKGQGDAILLAAGILGEQFLVIQPENVNAGEIAEELLMTADTSDEVLVGAARRPDYQLFAVTEHDHGRITKIVEKPTVASSLAPLCTMGVYLVNRSFIRTLSSVAQTPTNLVDAIAIAAAHSKARVIESKQVFLPLKFPGHLWAYARYLGQSPGPSNGKESRSILVSRGCRIENAHLCNVIIAQDVEVESGVRTVDTEQWNDMDAVVIGPEAKIGKGVHLYPGVKVGAGATIGNGLHIKSDIPDGAVVTS
jgi:NDP-sugar pyrophosphorylase family protein